MKKFIFSMVVIGTIIGCGDNEKADVAQDQPTPSPRTEISDTNISPWSPPPAILPPTRSPTESEKIVENKATLPKAGEIKTDETTEIAPEMTSSSNTKETGLALAKKNGCLACHSIDNKLVGPPWKDVAKRYKGDEGARDRLIAKVKQGGKGNWSDVTGGLPMPPYAPRVMDKDIEQLVDFVLSLAS